MKRILTLKEYWQKKYGHPLWRLAADPGFPCPHRDPSGKGGCIFCSSEGGRARHLTGDMSPEAQIERGIRYLRSRYHAEPPYALYFQAFTPTNAPLPELKMVYERFLAAAPEIAAVIVATRPDCLPDEVLDYFCELQKRYEVWVELGVQTACERTLQRIDRGHDFQAVKDAVSRLAVRKIPCAAHVILGLPGETQTDFDATADALAALPFSGVKLHHLLFLKNTPLEKLWRSGEVHPMTEAEYAAVLCRFLERLPENWVVMRLSADEGEGKVLAPRWFLDHAAFGRMFLAMYDLPPEQRFLFPPVRMDNGLFTLFHPGYRRHFNPLSGADLLPEDFFSFSQPFRFLEIGTGLGYSLCAAVQRAEQQRKGRMEIVTAEKELFWMEQAVRLPGYPMPELLTALLKNGRYESEYASVTLLPGDARQSLSCLPEHSFQRILVDGFDPVVNPELGSFEFLRLLRLLLTAEGGMQLSTADPAVRGALLELGFSLRKTENGGTFASRSDLPAGVPLSEKEKNILRHSTAGTPLRDPGLSGTGEEILSRRKAEVSARQKAGVPKRWRDQGISTSESMSVPVKR